MLASQDILTNIVEMLFSPKTCVVVAILPAGLGSLGVGLCVGCEEWLSAPSRSALLPPDGRQLPASPDERTYCASFTMFLFFFFNSLDKQLTVHMWLSFWTPVFLVLGVFLGPKGHACLC